jgi:SAM-dependent methyltransferase
MSEVFGRDYSSIYDALYRAKDYEGEVDLIEGILRQHELAGSRRLLDLGCGTGNHTLPLARRGHTVVGVDRSSPMLAQARAKAAEMSPADGKRMEFKHGDIRTIDLERRFDAALMMFTVMGYLHEDSDLAAALRTVRRHLIDGGLFLFDVWNGPAVMADKPRDRWVTVNGESEKITRKTKVALDELGHICRVHFDLERGDGRGSIERWSEEHVMRFYFPDELELKLRQNGLDLLTLRRFPDNEAPPDEKAWNVIGVARAII